MLKILMPIDREVVALTVGFIRCVCAVPDHQGLAIRVSTDGKPAVRKKGREMQKENEKMDEMK